MNQKFDAAFFGEAMLRYSPMQMQRLSSSEYLQVFAGGAELNVAAGLAQLGLKTAFCSKLPSNALSQHLQQKIKAYGVSDQYMIHDANPQARLGVYYYEKASAPQKPRVVYDRLFSSFRSVEFDEIPPEFYLNTKLFHTTGITLGLCENTKNVAIEVMKKCRENHIKLSFDINYRANLWTDTQARKTIEPLLPLVDILFISEESLRKMFARKGDLAEILRSFSREYGVSYLFTSMRKALSPLHHTFTSIAYDAKKDVIASEHPYEIDIIDRIGSGDAFVAGALFGLLSQQSIEPAVQYANAMAAAKCGIPGDITVITKAEIDALIASHGSNSTESEINR